MIPPTLKTQNLDPPHSVIDLLQWDSLMGRTSWRSGDRGVTVARAETDNRRPPKTRASATSNAMCTIAAPTSCHGKSASMASGSETRTATVRMPGRSPLPSSKGYLSKSYLRRLVHNFFPVDGGSQNTNLIKISPFISLSVCFCSSWKDLTQPRLRHVLVTSCHDLFNL